ncbi:MAG: anti-sigma factor [Blastocatellales bacterium]
MRCAQAEKLIPLFAGGDLSAREAEALNKHLESCADCRQLASEFEESRDWLNSFAAPQFDEAMLDGLRDSVLKEIGQEETRPGLLKWILPSWNPRFAFAASLALLLLIAAFSLLIYRRQPLHAPKRDQAEMKKDASDKLELHPVETRDEQGSRIVERKPGQPRITRKSAGTESPQPEAQTVAPDFVAQNIEPPDPAKTDLASNREMTRIEFQTADPNIRIIWFAPKTGASPVSRP